MDLFTGRAWPRRDRTQPGNQGRHCGASGHVGTGRWRGSPVRSTPTSTSSRTAPPTSDVRRPSAGSRSSMPGRGRRGCPRDPAGPRGHGLRADMAPPGRGIQFGSRSGTRARAVHRRDRAIGSHPDRDAQSGLGVRRGPSRRQRRLLPATTALRRSRPGGPRTTRRGLSFFFPVPAHLRSTTRIALRVIAPWSDVG